ncbi:putative phospholipase B1, membrane-associated [Apostichopus japonicus]|uniref:Phospholipase B1, membrane-associated n=1 Tax=Stichopus japonicus TaxID=307972 RepID=A0A2G8JPK8_STIJA|nr:putative phospholipase B1, membrane-associated [Apostichopus japonicus]
MKILLSFVVICFVGVINGQGYDVKYIGEYLDLVQPAENETTGPLQGFLERLPGYECSQEPTWPGETRFSFPCIPMKRSATKPTSVHYLRPSDVDVIGALGDSLSSANGADACFLPELAYMYRGRCFSSGADGDFHTNPTLATILMKFNPNLKGYSLRTNWWTAPEAGFNVAVPGAVADDMPEQARAIITKMQEDKSVDFENDWKVVTIFIGGNDLCAWCDSNGNERAHRTPEAFTAYIEEAIQILYDGMPRVFVNVVNVLQVHQVSKMTGFICDFFHNSWCSAGMNFPEETLAQTRKYNIAVRDMVNMRKFEGREDFAVVVQPFLEETVLPVLPNGDPDYSYFAPDCFHFSSKAHAVAGKELWNNMMEKVGEKSIEWDETATDVLCPTEEFPYIYTKLNSQSDFDITPPGSFAITIKSSKLFTFLLALLPFSMFLSR